ncbi:hydantoinase B/oxoprolinase family protein [Beijerinckia sp. L45]|uniref:hydantoinase B/oxoprolinase family protein n=1 Tax=Beijerinckia sp. L45 TaxID=1641855 RepID=UPI00131B9B1C|nr:hydantoinase B/oxoprolinase family protein [Beijerinckia sp. L45]
MGWQFWVDRGGTFTDIVAVRPDGSLQTHKLLSERPDHYRDAAVAGIKHLLGVALDSRIPDGLIDGVRMGTTVATNALLERKGEPVLLVVNRGFEDALRIGDQTRPKLFDLNILLPDPLYQKVAEVSCRVGADGIEVSAVDEDEARRLFAEAAANGFKACAIALMHAWKYPAQEQTLAGFARDAGFEQVSVSHDTSRLLRLIPRAETTVVDAYVSPILKRYVDQFVADLPGVPVLFMQSHGGLAEANAFRGRDALLSGPAGGLVGAARTAAVEGVDHIIGFDMGGTSTDVCLYAGQFERTVESEIGGVKIRVPMLSINTVAAGGGSILVFDGARFRVGPESAGATPGPACYRRGGPLTVTDANVLLGKIRASHFPKIFGDHGDAFIDVDVVSRKFDQLATDVEQATGRRMDPRDIAEGFVQVAVANMARAIKQVSLYKGLDPSAFTLSCFGGAGGQHACLVADQLGIGSILLHPFAGVLSAYGMGLADRSALREQAVEKAFERASLNELQELAGRLTEAAAADLGLQGAGASAIRYERWISLRHQGTEAVLVVAYGTYDEIIERFDQAHRRQFGFPSSERGIVVDSLRVIALRETDVLADLAVQALSPAQDVDLESGVIWSNGASHAAPVFERTSLPKGKRIEGPALIKEANATTVIEIGWSATVTSAGHLLLQRTVPLGSLASKDLATADPVKLELFNNIFMSIAEQTGTVLQNTAQSVNIKERLDFSCAIFDSDGNLVANAPHVPVHLGAMSESVRLVLRSRGSSLNPGDVIALNNPYAGGTHLPDITVITPVFADGGRDILFFVGSRGHHADIGGTTPGSMPPNSRRLEEEGVVIDDFLLVTDGVFQEQAFRELLSGGPYPARSPDVNVADIKAQIAANQKGVHELERVIATYGRDTVLRYMGFVMDNAEESVRKVIDRIKSGSTLYTMDDGSPLAVRVEVDHARRTAVVDFTGTGAQREDNFNAPPAVSRAAVLYVFRCLVGQDIPLNDGCLRPITIIIPPRTFLSPEPGHAVVAGNTEVSQAICNALFLALGALACGQGTMNNFLFGDATRQYYETICGGAGAGPGFDGASAVHTHMTNTRMTDPEVFELRYPVRVEQFSVRTGSGGRGRHRGGDGAVRRLRFLEPMTAVLVSSRRTQVPLGLDGGDPGAVGRQWIQRLDGTNEGCPGIFRAEVGAGDCIVIETPGGGGFGSAQEAS